MDFQFQVMLDALPSLLKGLRYTVLISVVGILGGLALGLTAGLAQVYGGRGIRGTAIVYVTLIRGTPLVVQALFIYFALPLMIGLKLDALTAAMTALAINAGAYIAEIVRGAVLSVDDGLVEAGRALGLRRSQIFRKIVGPIAARRMIPPLGNQVIISVKDTSLFVVIGVAELTRQGQEFMATTFRAMEVWCVVAVLYLLLTGVIAWGLRRLESRITIY